MEIPVKYGLVSLIYYQLSRENAKPILTEKQQWYYLTHNWGEIEIILFQILVRK